MKKFLSGLTPNYVILIICYLIFLAIFIFSPINQINNIVIKIVIFFIGSFITLLVAAWLFNLLFVYHPDK